MNFQEPKRFETTSYSAREQHDELRHVAIALVALLWIGALCGFVFLARYEGTPGLAGYAREHWPSGSKLQPSSDVCTAVIFLHPECPCSVASVEELAKINAHCRDKLKIIAVLSSPASNADWRDSFIKKSPVRSSLDSIRGITQIDDSGTESRCFGVETSGDLVLYGPLGNLLFKGGITYARGHTGDNPGGEDVIAAVNNNESVTIKRAPVFGCSLK